MCLEGNHEAWLRYYSSKDPKDFEKIRSSEFRDNTLPQIKSIDVSDIRQFCRSLGQLAFFNYHDKTWLVTHGGIPVMPSLKLSTVEYIKGVGKYEDVSQVAEAWKSRYPDFICQVHGHRNLEQVVPNAEDQVINLNSAVEFGEPLRVLELREVCGECKTRILSFENPVHKPAPVTVRQLNDPESNNEIIKYEKREFFGFLKSSFINYFFNKFFVNGKNLVVDENCIKCGKCIKSCPLNNISLVNGKIKISNNCMFCLSCLNNCPKNAITFMGKKNGTYSCPSVEDFLKK